jgi:hypothetical protein
MSKSKSEIPNYKKLGFKAETCETKRERRQPLFRRTKVAQK